MQNRFIQKIAGSLLLFTIVFLTGQSVQAQLKVGSNPGTLNAGAMLEIESPTTNQRGFLPPRVALTATTGAVVWGLAGVATDGMMVYNTATTSPALTGASAVNNVSPGFYVWQNSAWKAVVASSGDATSTSGKVTFTGTTTGALVKSLSFNVNETLFDLATMGSATGGAGVPSFLPINRLAVGSATTGQVLTYDGTTNGIVWKTPAAGGINSLGGSTVASQTFANGSAGLTPGFSTNTGTGVHTLNIPLASATGVTAGLLSKTDYDSFAGKESALTFLNGLTRGTGGDANKIKLGGNVSENILLEHNGRTVDFRSNSINFTISQQNTSTQQFNPFLSFERYVGSGGPIGGASTQSTSPVGNGSGIGGIVFRGYTGTAMANGAYIGAESESTFSANNSGSRLIFSTVPTTITPALAGTSPLERMRITNAGNVGIGTPDSGPTNQLHVVGPNPLRLVGLVNITPVAGDSVLVFSGAGGVIKKASVSSINNAVATMNTLSNSGTATVPILSSNVNGTTSTYTLPIATGSVTGLLSSTDYTTLTGKENVLTFGNGITRTGNTIALGGTLATGGATIGFGTNNLTFNSGNTAGKVIVGGPVGNTSGLQLSNLTGTATTGAVGQKVLSVDASGNVTLVTDFGTNNAGTVTNVSGTAPISVTTGTTPVISLNDAGITTAKIADGAVTTAKIAGAGTAGQVLTSNGATAPTFQTLSATSVNAWGLTGNAETSATTNFVGTTDAQPLRLFTNVSERIRILSGVAGAAGTKVGIGTSTPIGRLHIQGTGSNGDTLLYFGISRAWLIQQSGNEQDTYLNFRGAHGTATDTKSVAISDFSNNPIFSAGGAGNARRVTLIGSLNGTVLSTNQGLIFERVTNAGFRMAANDTISLQSGTGSSSAFSGNSNQIALLPNGFVSVGSYGTTTVGSVTTTNKPSPTSTLDVNGSVSHSIVKVTANRTLNATNHTVLANVFAAGITLTLPAPSTCEGRVYVIRKTDESSNTITFAFPANGANAASGTNAIRVSDSSDTAGVYINSLNYVKTLRIQSDGTDWYLID